MTSDDIFELALQFTLEAEGGEANVPGDKGGHTKCGVTQATYTDWLKRHGNAPKEVKGITSQEIHAIYREEYWLAPKLSLLVDGSMPRLAIAVFDFGVNAGTGRAVKKLQSLVDAGKDGVLGPHTVACAQTRAATLSDRALALQYVVQRIAYHRSIAVGDNEQFLEGWLNRCHALSKYLASLNV